MLEDLEIVPGQLFRNERYILRDAAALVAKEFENPSVVNIGIWKGASCHCLKLGAPNAALIGIDVMGTYPFETHGLPEFLSMCVIKRNSNYVDWGHPIHLLFVDGGHEYEVVKRDIEIYCPHVVIGGYALFHDAGRQEIQQAMREALPVVGKWKKLPESTSNIAWLRRLGDGGSW